MICSCLQGARHVAVRDPWCPRHGELPVGPDAQGIWHLPEWTVGMCIDGRLIIRMKEDNLEGA